MAPPKAVAKKRTDKLLAQSANYGSVHLDVMDPNQHWDYVIAFPNPEHRTVPAPVSMEEILQKLHEHGLQFKLFYSATRDMVMCQIRAHYDRLKMEADRIDMPVLLDKAQLQVTAERGFPDLGIAPFAISDVKHLYDFQPYEHIHAAYEDDEELQYLFESRNLDGTVFAPVERMKLIESIIVSHECCNIDLDTLCMNGSILACYPLHNEDEIAHLAATWIPRVAAPWKQPISEIRDYFGERIGFYFAYLGHYTTWLMYSSIVGFIVFALKMINDPKDVMVVGSDNVTRKSEVPSVMTYAIPIFAVFMCIWATLFMESWKREQNVLAMKWGMSELDDFDENPRPQFTGEPVLSAITGVKTRYFPTRQKYQRVAVSWALLFLLCSVVIVIVSGIFWLRFKYAGANGLHWEIDGVKLPVGVALCSGANVIQIIIMGKIYYRSFYRLNEYENHETDSQYENSLVLKTFVFQFINNFSALIYIAFLKNSFEEPSNDRLHELAYSLAIVYGSQLVIGNVKEILLPRVWVWLSKRSIIKQEAVAEQSEAEKQFFLATYEWSGTFDDYTEIITQFGFCTLFVVSFPLTPLLSLLNNYLEIRIDGYRLLFENRRPRPRNASSIGLWMEIIEFMTTLAILTNAYVVVWTSNTFDFIEVKYEKNGFNYIELYRVQAFMIFVAVMLAFRYFIAKLISDVPPSVIAQIKRQLFFNNKAIYRLPDDVVSKYVRPKDDVFDMTIQESG
ncbi:anoctamin-like protein [Achlya hypogyna]|uniref:Anoctamin-like protein n=1 Tax=Achlya hypogyna TaxID=1202772 RepID=A0A1V9YI52_ACHHY|nr:anoctamin-like protein [Achlya hypogyna]